MAERERGSTLDADEAIPNDRGDAPPVVQARPVPVTDAVDEDARHKRFIAALDRVMSDHRNVLAALAK